LGKLSKKEQSDDAGQFVGKRVGSARARMRKERSDDRNPATAPAAAIAIDRCNQEIPPEKKTDRPKAARLVLS